MEAGIDLIQHPELLAGRPYSEALLTQIRERGVICSMLVNTITGAAWEQHLADVAAAEARLADVAAAEARLAGEGRAAEWGHLRRPVTREKTSFERRRERTALGHDNAMRRQNAKSLIDAGCIVTLGTDNFPAADIQFLREPKPIWQEPGIGTLMAIEGLVELGMTPSEAIVAGTRNGAFAARGLDDFGTIEVGKFADLVLLDANPLDDIRNIRRQAMVMKEGR